MLISIAIPIYNEAELLPELYCRLSTVSASSEDDLEFVFVDDGSVDRSRQLLEEYSNADPRVRVVLFSRNFGHQAACTAAIEHSRGDAVILMDGDLQDPPEVIPTMVSEWKSGANIVVARRRTRQERGPRALLTRLFYRALSSSRSLPISGDIGVFSLMDRQVVDQLVRFRERNRYLPGLRAVVGFRTREVPYDRDARFAGESKQSFWRLVTYALDAIFSFSYTPLRLASVIGFGVSTLAFLYGITLVFARLLSINVVPGFTSTTVTVLFLGGLQLMFIGILGEYVARMYDELKARPLFIVDRVIESCRTTNETEPRSHRG